VQGKMVAELRAPASGNLDKLRDGFAELMRRGIDASEAMRTLKESALTP
jgi:hypothetical protein